MSIEASNNYQKTLRDAAIRAWFDQALDLWMQREIHTSEEQHLNLLKKSDLEEIKNG